MALLVTGSNALELEVVNRFQLTCAESVRGLDFLEPDGLLLVSPSDLRVYVVDAEDGSFRLSLSLAPGNGQPFGVSRLGDRLYANDMSDPLVYLNGGLSWSSRQNPLEDGGRGMDAAVGMLWQCRVSPPGVCAMDTSLTQHQTCDLPGMPSGVYASGLCAWEDAGDAMVGVTCYWDGRLWVYRMGAGGPSLEGIADMPLQTDQSLGLAYSESRGTVFWSYSDGAGGYWIAELELIGTALSESTWGALKASF